MKKESERLWTTVQRTEHDQMSNCCCIFLFLFFFLVKTCSDSFSLTLSLFYSTDKAQSRENNYLFQNDILFSVLVFFS